MKKILSFILGIIETLIIAYVIFLTGCLLFVNSFGYTQFGKYTLIEVEKGQATLLDGTSEGDLLIIKNDGNITQGTVIYYYTVINEKYFVKSAPVKKVKDDGFGAIYDVEVETKGETAAIQEKKVLGNSISRHPKLGDVLEVLESKVGFLFLVLLPMMCIFIYHVYLFIVVLKFEKVEDEEEEEEIEEKRINY